MPQDNQTPPQIPGSDVLLDTLRRSRINDDQRQQLWDAYHTPGDEKAFVGAMRGLDVDDGTRQTLYDMRFKGFKNEGNKAQGPQAAQSSVVANLDTQKQAKGDVRPSTADTLQKTTGIRAPTTWERMGNVVAPFMQHMRQGGGASDERLLAPEALTSSQHPMLQATGEFAGGLTTAPNLVLAAGGGVLSEASPVLSKLLNLGFSQQMLKGAYEQYKPFRDAIANNDSDGALYHFTHMVLGGAMGLHSATDGMSTDPKTRMDVKKNLDVAAKLKGSDPVLNSAVRQAATLPDKATPMGPISETGGQQLQLDFAGKAPTEARSTQVTATAAAKSADPLIAPQHTDYVGANAPVGLHRFPSSAIEDLATGKTLGVGKVDINAPAPKEVYRRSMAPDETTSRATPTSTIADKMWAGLDQPISSELHKDLEKIAGGPLTPEQAGVLNRKLAEERMQPGASDPTTAIREERRSQLEKPDPNRYAKPQPGAAGLKVSTDSLGVKWAEDDKGIRVSIPKSVSDEQVQNYAASKIAEQAEGQKTVKQVQAQRPSLGDTFDTLADLRRKADLAEDDKHASAFEKERSERENAVMGQQREWLTQQPDETIQKYAKLSADRAQQLEAQGKAIKDLTEATIKNRGVKKEIADLRSQGGPVRLVPDPEGGPAITVKPEDRVGRGGRSVLDELQGRVPTSEFETLKVAGKPEGVSDEEWGQYTTKLQEERQGLKKNISTAVTEAAAGGYSLDDVLQKGLQTHIDRLKEIEGLLGKSVESSETGRRPNIPAELDEQGAIKAPEALKSWSIERARLALGRNLRTMPTDEEFFQHSDLRYEKGRLFRQVADLASQVLDSRKGQRGVIGEGPLKGQVQRVSLKDMVPDDKEVLKRAKAAQLYAREIDEKFPMGVVGFLSKDGKIGIDSGNLTHDDVAQRVLPDIVKANTGSALRAMLEKGWIRKASPVNYEAWNLDRSTLHTIDHDLLVNGRYGQAIDIDTRRPSDGRMSAISLDSGWDERFKSLEAAVQNKIQRSGFGTAWSSSETGAIKGTTLAASSTIGGIIGSVVGAHLGHPYEGGAIGWGLGFITPAIADHPLLWNKINAIKPAITSLGISAHDWLMGPKQLDPVNTDMRTILDAQQRDVRGSVKSVMTRVAQLPGDLQHKMFDKFVFISDRPGAVSNFLMKFDERGRAFRDLRGKLDVDNSPYVSAWLAAGGGGGMAEAHMLDYKTIYKDAQSKGLVNNLNEYLNLKGYQRVYDVMQERIQEHDQNIQKMQQALQQPKLPVEVEAGIKKALRESKAAKQDIIDKLTSKTLVPQPYDPPKIVADLQNLQQTLGPKFNDVQALAGKVFGLNRKVLDMVHDAGIVGDADYQKYVSRGDEYIPMHRIMEQVADNTAKTSGKGSPLYLRQQNVVKALMGSDRINRDPVVASADANLEAMREVMRNGVIKDYLKIAHADPQGVGSYFKQVPSGYKAQPGEGIVGVYENGMQHSFATPSWLSESLKNVSPAALDVIGKGPLQYFGQILRKGATMGNLAWSVPNALRHLGDMAIMSDAGLKDVRTLPRDAAGLVRDWTKSVYGSITHDPVWQEYMRSGAAYSTLQRMISPEQSLDLNTLGFKQKIARGRVIEVVQDFNAAVEDATKMTTYRRLREAGYTEKAAAWETRRYGGGPDFAKQGNLTPAINLASMFFNAHLQYVSRVFARAAENPARVAVALGAITGMAMALNEHNVQQKDEKGNQLIRKVPYTDRENNFVVLTGDTYQSSSGATLPVYYKVPKPSFVKFLYNPIENMLNKVAGNEERSGVQLGLQALGNLSPGQMDLQQDELGKSVARGVTSSLNPILKTPIEEAMNYKTTGTGGPIVPGREQNIDSRFQYGPGTSPVAQRLGEGGMRGTVAGAAEGASIGYLLGGPKGAAFGGALGGAAGTFGVSPRRAEHIIDSTTAGVGRIATGFVDPFLAGVKQTHMEGPEKLSQTPIAGPILGRFVSTSIDQQEQSLTQEFYRNAQVAQAPMNTIKFLEKNHPEQIPQYIQDHKNDLWKANVATQMQGRLGQILNAQKSVEQNQNMSDSDRATALKNLHEVKMQVLNVFTKVIKPSPSVPQAVAFPGQGQGNAR